MQLSLGYSWAAGGDLSVAENVVWTFLKKLYGSPKILFPYT